MRDEKEQFFDYEVKDGHVIVKECFIKEYIERQKFSGSRSILPWAITRSRKSCCHSGNTRLTTACLCCRTASGDHLLPCKKQKAWDTHPVFTQADGNGGFKPLALTEVKNMDFTVNFTHPSITCACSKNNCCANWWPMPGTQRSRHCSVSRTKKRH